MDWITITGLLSLGIILIGLEVIFIPGSTFVGILGFIASSFGIYFAYTEKGDFAGHLSFAGSIIASGLLLYVGIKAKMHKKMGLNDTINGTSPNKLNDELSVGIHGSSVSALRPSGQAQFNNIDYEVHSSFGFIDSNTEIEVLEIKDNKIFVKTK